MGHFGKVWEVHFWLLVSKIVKGIKIFDISSRQVSEGTAFYCLLAHPSSSCDLEFYLKVLKFNCDLFLALLLKAGIIYSYINIYIWFGQCLNFERACSVCQQVHICLFKLINKWVLEQQDKQIWTRGLFKNFVARSSWFWLNYAFVHYRNICLLAINNIFYSYMVCFCDILESAVFFFGINKKHSLNFKLKSNRPLDLLILNWKSFNF